MPRATCEGCKKREKCTKLCKNIDRKANLGWSKQPSWIVYEYQMNGDMKAWFNEKCYGIKELNEK